MLEDGTALEMTKSVDHPAAPINKVIHSPQLNNQGIHRGDVTLQAYLVKPVTDTQCEITVWIIVNVTVNPIANLLLKSDWVMIKSCKK